MIRRIWEWLGNNWAPLTGMSVIIGMLAVSLPILSYLSKAFQTDLLVTVSRHESTMPPDLGNWDYDLAIAMDDWRHGAVPPPVEQLTQSPTAKKLLHVWSEIALLESTITNQSDRTISGVRFRVDTSSSLWGVFVAGTFLTDAERSDFQKRIDASLNPEDLVLPELPAIPPGGALTIRAYMRSLPYSSKPSIAVQNASVKIIEIVNVEDFWLVHWYRTGLFKGFAYAFIPVIMLLVLFTILSRFVRFA